MLNYRIRLSAVLLRLHKMMFLILIGKDLLGFILLVV